MGTYVKILKGAKDFQIFQQIKGTADITVSGTYNLLDGYENVWLRIVSEDYSLSVVDWQMATHIDDKNFTITFKDVPSGGLYRIESGIMNTINNCTWAYRGDTIFHIGVGDLFVIAGQSNSTGYSRTPIEDTMELGVNLLRNSEQWDIASHPMNDGTNSLHENNLDGANVSHCPYLAFGKKMKKYLGYPIGLISASKGGSPLAAWNIEEDGYLYRNMIDIIKKGTNSKMRVAGILWYQGCSDAEENISDSYLNRFNTMVNKMRKDLKDKKLPIYTVQLNKLMLFGDDKKDKFWGKIREAQRQAAVKIPNVYVVPSIDLSMSDAIHNNSSANVIIGERLANVALNQTYGKLPSAMAPNFTKAIKIDENNIKLIFENVVGFISSVEMPIQLSQLEVKVNDEKVQIMRVLCQNNEIIATLEKGINSKEKIEISFCNNAFVHQIVPYDVGTGMPVLAFNTTL